MIPGTSRVSIVIPAYNAEKTIGSLVAACLSQESPGADQVLVVDDGSTDRTGELAQAAGARVERQENRGPAAARNRGWRAASGEVVLFTDSDCIPQKDWVRRLTAGIGADHAVACGSYGIANPESRLARLIHAEILWRHARLPDEVEFAGSYNFAARREALERVGGFDESFPAPSGEDNDLSYRLRDAGFRIRFRPDALVNHHHPTQLAKYLREQARHGRWRVFLYLTHPGRLRGDGYAGGGDFLAPVFAVASMGLVPAAGVAGVMGGGAAAGALGAAALGCFAVVFGIHLLLSCQVVRRSRDPENLELTWLGTVRAYARGVGLLHGVAEALHSKMRPVTAAPNRGTK